MMTKVVIFAQASGVDDSTRSALALKAESSQLHATFHRGNDLISTRERERYWLSRKL